MSGLLILISFLPTSIQEARAGEESGETELGEIRIRLGERGGGFGGGFGGCMAACKRGQNSFPKERMG